MSFKCNIGLHNWDGCKCTECGAIRDKEHDTSADCGKCARCGKDLGDRHNWTIDCEKCSDCGKTRENHHSWLKNCERCSSCGAVRTDMHRIENGVCQVCGHGSFHDESDGTIYNVIKIGDHILMADNYRRKPVKGNCWIYDDKEVNLARFGYLYDWETARSIAPRGWHLPVKEEWESLIAFLGGDGKKVYSQLRQGGETGFECLFGGERLSRGAFNSLNASANFWSATADPDNQVWQFKLGAYTETAGMEKVDPGFGLSIRFFKDK
ncbi:MAG: FISUMP domain-containing protein [Bacteroidales bacterium]|jgi:uncharacterized protein (TIGR02145 family)